MNEEHKSLVDLAYEVLSERYEAYPHANEEEKKKYAMPFGELLQEVSERAGLTPEQAVEKGSSFYTALTVDGRFVIKGDNTWVLKEHELFKDIHIDMNDAYDEIGDEDEDDDDNAQKKSKKDEDEDNDNQEDVEEELVDGSKDEAPVVSGDDDDSDN